MAPAPFEQLGSFFPVMPRVGGVGGANSLEPGNGSLENAARHS